MNKIIKVAIQGIGGSFHEAAAGLFFGKPISTVECMSFHELCEALKVGRADYAVMAIENSIAGSILPNYFLLQKYRFSISAEVYLPIHMHLLTLPGVRRSEIKIVESHPMAIRQCSEFLHSMKGIEIRECDDTALAAKRVASEKLRNTAAIANEQAAKKYGLRILERRIETHKKNFTRFLLLSKNPKNEKANKASLSFEVANKVGSLADALQTFKRNDLNLSKIQSIPILGKPSEYTIHVDVEWKQKKQYNQTLKEIHKQVHELTILGEYAKAKIKF